MAKSSSDDAVNQTPAAADVELLGTVRTPAGWDERTNRSATRHRSGSWLASMVTWWCCSSSPWGLVSQRAPQPYGDGVSIAVARLANHWRRRGAGLATRLAEGLRHGPAGWLAVWLLAIGGWPTAPAPALFVLWQGGLTLRSDSGCRQPGHSPGVSVGALGEVFCRGCCCTARRVWDGPRDRLRICRHVIDHLERSHGHLRKEVQRLMRP